MNKIIEDYRNGVYGSVDTFKRIEQWVSNQDKIEQEMKDKIRNFMNDVIFDEIKAI